MEYRLKINSIMKTITFLDYEKPKIVKSSATKMIWEEKMKESEKKQDKLFYQNTWYNDYFKQETKKYIKNKSERDIKNNSAPEYVKCALKYINEEYERENTYINIKFHDDINNINYEYLIANNMNQIAEMDTGIKYMFETRKKDELYEVYKLFTLFPESLKLIQKSFRVYIKERLTALYNDKELSKDPKKFIPTLISLKKEMDEFVVLCFDNHPDFQDQENKEFYQLMSKDIYPKQLANYADHCMRVGFKGKSEEEIESTLNDIISLFKNINSKLIFQVETEKKMSDRLIKNSSLSLNAEKSFISKLKQESGVTYVSKMNEMINDLEKNKSEIEGYKSTKSRGMPSGIKFNVQIISQSAWDISKSNMEKIEILPFLKACIDDFEDYYLKRHQQTKLIWCLSLSKVEIQYLKLKNKNISTSTIPQLLTLLYLEKMGTLSLEKIAQLLGCNVQKVINDVRGLILNPSFNMKGQIDKGVILANIDPKTKEFKPETQISINMNFSVTHQKFNTLPLPLKKTAAELKASEAEEAQITKRYQDNILQATLTRIMKSRIGQQTTHVWLVNESAKQIDLFKAQPQQIKENIEKLIEKSIIKRNGANYEYIA
jgi:cullin 3